MARSGPSLESPPYQDDFGSLSLAHPGFGHPSMSFEDFLGWTPSRERIQIADLWDDPVIKDGNVSDGSSFCADGAQALSDDLDEIRSVDDSKEGSTLSMPPEVIEKVKKDFGNFFEFSMRSLPEKGKEELGAAAEPPKMQELTWRFEEPKVGKEMPDRSEALLPIPPILRQWPDELDVGIQKPRKQTSLRREIPPLIPLDTIRRESLSVMMITQIVHLKDEDTMKHCCISCNTVLPHLEVHSGRITAPRHWAKWASPPQTKDRIMSSQEEALVSQGVIGNQAQPFLPLEVITSSEVEFSNKAVPIEVPCGGRGGNKKKSRKPLENRRKKKLKTRR